ncbi:hypothetical protein BRADI_1g39276v3 [Brachypodium distachyon]|uniref:Uncharacterized protein n=1 Tax=Brachypodium distachyon TaxID=15368 RepID=A0A0Q3H6M7_BRADI|nr:hypothetical protein BRADI_1g39276v3 [Brachypodium distachyon]
MPNRATGGPASMAASHAPTSLLCIGLGGGQPSAGGVDVVGRRRRGDWKIPRGRASRARSIAVDGAPIRCHRHTKCRIHGVIDERQCGWIP